MKKWHPMAREGSLLIKKLDFITAVKLQTIIE